MILNLSAAEVGYIVHTMSQCVSAYDNDGLSLMVSLCDEVYKYFSRNDALYDMWLEEFDIEI